MPIRPFPLLQLLMLSAALLALPLRGEEFPLERHIPADFHYRYLSISPDVNLHANDNEQDAPENVSESDRKEAGFGLELRHGSQLSTRRLLLSLGNGLDLRRYDSRHAYRERYVSGAGSESGSGREGGSWNYGLHAHPSVQWFFLPKLFLSASAESRFHHLPETPSTATDWRLARPLGGPPDSVRYLHRRSRGRSGAMVAGLHARVGAGFGRIEKVGSAARILDLLDRITEVTGRPARLSPEEMHALEARVEARRKQRGFLGPRRASLHDLETVEMFLRGRGADATGLASTGAAGSPPPRALLAMADEWFHTAPRRRESGFEVKVQPYLAWTWNESRSRSTRNEYARTLPADAAGDPSLLAPRGSDTAFTQIVRSRSAFFSGERILGAGLEAAWRRPWRRRFQFDADAYARASTRSVELGESSSYERDGVPDPTAGGRYLEFEHPRVEGRWDLSLSWYPDSRSRLTGGMGGTGARAFDYTGSKASLTARLGREPELRSWSLNHRLHAEAEYLPGYRLSFTAGAAADLDWSSSADDRLEMLGRLPPTGGLSRSGLDRSFRVWADLAYYLF